MLSVRNPWRQITLMPKALVQICRDNNVKFLHQRKFQVAGTHKTRKGNCGIGKNRENI